VPASAFDHHRHLLNGDWARAAQTLRSRGRAYDAALALTDSEDPSALWEALDQFRTLGARAAEAISM
jgi:hypothetical protein